MRMYVMLSGAIFGLVTLAHLVRIYAEGVHLARDPWYVSLTILTAAFCVWAFRLLRVPARP